MSCKELRTKKVQACKVVANEGNLKLLRANKVITNDTRNDDFVFFAETSLGPSGPITSGPLPVKYIFDEPRESG